MKLFFIPPIEKLHMWQIDADKCCELQYISKFKFITYAEFYISYFLVSYIIIYIEVIYFFNASHIKFNLQNLLFSLL